MVVRSIITGSWFPRTKLHLKEYFAFLQTGTSHLPIDPKSLRTARRKLSPKDPAYVGGAFDSVTSRCGEYTVTYYEDGLLLIAGKVNDLEKDVAALRRFYDQRLAPALSLIYSIGTPAPVRGVEHEARRPVFIVTDRGDDSEAAEMAAVLRDRIHHTARHGDAAVHFADDTLIISAGPDDGDLTDRLVNTLLLSREYEHKLRHFLDVHRSTWESLEKLQTRRSLTPGELPDIRNRLLAYQRELLVLNARLLQMAEYLPVRQKEADDSGLAPALHALKAYRFDKLRSATNYLNRLWKMLLDYLASTTEITGLVYQENLHKEIEVQQFIFLLGALASVFMLGSVAGARLTFFGADGALLSHGALISFSIYDLARFGGAALVITFLFMAILKPYYRYRKMSNLLGDAKKKE